MKKIIIGIIISFFIFQTNAINIPEIKCTGVTGLYVIKNYVTNTCKCYEGYHFTVNYLKQTICEQDKIEYKYEITPIITIPTTCTDKYGENSYTNDEGKCQCSYGYDFGTDSSGDYKCIDIKKICLSTKGSNSYYNTDTRLCKCNDGYESGEHNVCEKIKDKKEQINDFISSSDSEKIRKGFKDAFEKDKYYIDGYINEKNGTCDYSSIQIEIPFINMFNIDNHKSSEYISYNGILDDEYNNIIKEAISYCKQIKEPLEKDKKLKKGACKILWGDDFIVDNNGECTCRKEGYVTELDYSGEYVIKKCVNKYQKIYDKLDKLESKNHGSLQKLLPKLKELVIKTKDKKKIELLQVIIDYIKTKTFDDLLQGLDIK